MAANISIDAEKAEIWVKDVEAEIEEVNGVLNRVTGVLTTVAGDDDTIMQGIYNYGTRLQDSWQQMCKGFTGAVDLLHQAFRRHGEVASELLEGVQGLAGKIAK